MELLYPEATCHLIPLAERCQQEMAIYLQTLLVGFTVASQWETDAGQGRPLVCLAGICSCSVESILSALSYPFIFFIPLFLHGVQNNIHGSLLLNFSLTKSV